MDKEIEKYCKYCEKAQALYDPDTMLCPRFGVVSAMHKCRKFKYDPLKRVPARRVLTQENIEDQLEYVEI